MSSIESTKDAYPLFEIVREGSEPNIFLPKRQNVGDAGHDVRVFVENTLENEVIDEICYGLISRMTDAAFWQSNRTPMLDRKPLIDTAKMADFESWGKWGDYIAESIKGLRVQLAEKRAVLITPGETKLLPTGFRVELPTLAEPLSMCMKIVGRSGWAGVDQICIANSPGIIDSGYRQEVFVAVENRSRRSHIISNEARIAQALFEVVYSFDTTELVVDSIENSNRGGKGSTGTH